jgi:hypothetical protein
MKEAAIATTMHRVRMTLLVTLCIQATYAVSVEPGFLI